jgi:hypothetical protein
MIIGVVGFIGSGKGTVSDILVDKYNFHKLSFADAVKDATAAIFGWPRHLLEGNTEESRAFRELNDSFWSERFGYNFSPRLALQLMGTEAGRDVFHPDVWIYALERKMAMYPNVVIADVRFPNEIKFIQSKGGFVIRVKRGLDPDWYNTALADNKNGLDPAVSQMSVYHPSIHYSEWAWIGQIMDHELHNTGTISSLEGDVSHMLKVFTGPQKSATIAA